MRRSNLERSLDFIGLIGLTIMMIQLICWIIKIIFIITYHTSKFIYVKLLKPGYIKLIKPIIYKIKTYVKGRLNGQENKTESKNTNDK